MRVARRSGSFRCILAPTSEGEGGHENNRWHRGIVGYAVVISMLLAAVLGFLQTAVILTPENASWYVQLGCLFGLMCAPVGAASGLFAGIGTHFVSRRLAAWRSRRVRMLATAVFLALGCVPGVVFAIWIYTNTALEIHEPSPLFLAELALAVSIVAGGGAVFVRFRLNRDRGQALVLFALLAQLPEVTSSDEVALQLRAVSPFSKGWAIVVQVSIDSLNAALNLPGNRALARTIRGGPAGDRDSELILELRNSLQSINLGTHELFLSADGKTFRPGLPNKLPPFRPAEVDREGEFR